MRRSSLAVLWLYLAIAIACLSPIASPDVIIDGDYRFHVAYTIQARMALEEGQFPLRVAPYELEGLRYPAYQFYSQIHTLSGLIYRFLTPGNPHIANQLLLLAALTLGAFFLYQTSFWLTKSAPAAILAGVLYLTFPYWLLNINVRGTLAEAIAQGWIPLVLYCTLRLLDRWNWPRFILSGMAWYCLAVTHLLTFLATSVFIALLCLGLRLVRQVGWLPLVRIAAAYLLGWLLALYFLGPILVLAPHLFIQDAIGLNPYLSHWLASWGQLTSPVAMPPEPLPGTRRLGIAYFYPGIGWSMLAAWAVMVYATLSREPSSPALDREQSYNLTGPLLWLFGLAFLIVWSPVDFWAFLPRIFWIVQFPYRILAQLSWIGALLSAYALIFLFNGHLDRRHLVIGTLLIGCLQSSWLLPPQGAITVAELIQRPRLQNEDYLYGDRNGPKVYDLYGNLNFLSRTNQDVILNQETLINLHLTPGQPRSEATWVLEGLVPDDLPVGDLHLALIINGQTIDQITLAKGAFHWQVPLPDLATLAPPFRFMITSQPAYTKEGKVPSIQAQRLVFQNLPPDRTAISAAAIAKSCHQAGATKRCQVTVTSAARVVQLPIFFYPGCLKIQVNSRRMDYFATPSRNYNLASLNLEPGTYEIAMTFTGLGWSNGLSALGWLFGISGLGASFGREMLRRSRVHEST